MPHNWAPIASAAYLPAVIFPPLWSFTSLNKLISRNCPITFVRTTFSAPFAGLLECL